MKPWVPPPALRDPRCKHMLWTLCLKGSSKDQKFKVTLTICWAPANVDSMRSSLKRIDLFSDLSHLYWLPFCGCDITPWPRWHIKGLIWVYNSRRVRIHHGVKLGSYGQAWAVSWEHISTKCKHNADRWRDSPSDVLPPAKLPHLNLPQTIPTTGDQASNTQDSGE